MNEECHREEIIHMLETHEDASQHILISEDNTSNCSNLPKTPTNDERIKGKDLMLIDIKLDALKGKRSAITSASFSRCSEIDESEEPHFDCEYDLSKDHAQTLTITSSCEVETLETTPNIEKINFKR